jgi:hypothetical protein
MAVFSQEKRHSQKITTSHHQGICSRDCIMTPTFTAPRLILTFIGLLLTAQCCVTQQQPSTPLDLPEAPSQLLLATSKSSGGPAASSTSDPFEYSFYPSGHAQQESAQGTRKGTQKSDGPAPASQVELDSDGKPIPLERQQPTRILGIMPNFRTVSSGAVPPPPSFKTNFKGATRQAFDYSSFFFLALTSVSAEGIDSHPELGKGVPGFYAYAWRGFLDKTDNTYLSAFLLPSILHEDTRYYALGKGPVIKRIGYVISRQAVTRTYGGSQTPNIAGLGGQVLTQVISRYYYPSSATDFSALATKFGYSVMRDVASTAFREFYPTIAAHYIRVHREKIAAREAQP